MSQEDMRVVRDRWARELVDGGTFHGRGRGKGSGVEAAGLRK